MRNFFLSGFLTPPRGKNSLAAQLGYCFTVILVILIVISNTISSAYTSVLEQDRAKALLSTSVASALAISHMPLVEGMTYPVQTNGYTVNIYTKAGNSFLRVFSSAPADKLSSEQVMLDGAGDEYRKSFELQEAVVVERSDASGYYVAGVAPIIGAEGTVSGLLEVLMPSSAFHATQNGISLSWIFTMISIATAMTIVYYETHKLLTTVFGQPDRQLPKIIRYGLSGCQSVSFFSAMACSMPPLVISIFLLHLADTKKAPAFFSVQFFILLGGVLFAWGFFGFRSLREHFVRRFTTRIALILFVFAAFVLLIVSSLFSNEFIYLLFLLPVGFSLGMVFYFQREYRIYASRLGYPEFSEDVIHSTQYTGFILGASVGSVMAGIIYERFGLLAVSLLCGVILFIVGVQALLFVQHCPPSSSPPLHLPNFLYAMSSKKSGTFIWSVIMTSGMQTAFFFLFMPHFLKTVDLSLATISFYFMLFAFVGNVVTRSFIKIFPDRLQTKGRILISAVLQVFALLILAVSPTAKVLVLTVVCMGLALGMHDFGFLEYYRKMIREDKKVLARSIIERAFATGAILGSIAYGLLFMTRNMRASLFVFTFFMAILLFAYPMVTLMYTQHHPHTDRSSHESGRHPLKNEVLPENQPPMYDPFLSNSNQQEQQPLDYYEHDVFPGNGTSSEGRDNTGYSSDRDNRGEW